MYKKEYFIKFLEKFSVSKRRKLQILQEVQFFFDKISITKKPNQSHFLHYKKYVRDNFKQSSYCFKLSCLNKYREFLKMEKFSYKYKKDHAFNSDFLTFSDYKKLLKHTTEKENLILQTLFLTGIRFSELKKLTVESLKNKFSFFNKTAYREIPLHADLKKKLKFYCIKNNITTGAVFLSNFKNTMSYTAIRNMLSKIAVKAKIKKCKATKTHNFRRLFILYALQFMEIEKIQKIVGHENINTTYGYIPVDKKIVQKIINKNFYFDKKATID
jgi:site-specific recombinase XerD